VTDRQQDQDVARSSLGGDSDRRTFLKRGALSAGAVALAHPGKLGRSHKRKLRTLPPSKPEPPNILTIVVDQLRSPMWMPVPLAGAMPHLASLSEKSVSFERHYTAANDCSPARSVLLTGLYTHQTGVMITGGSWLDPRFPTWGTLLRDFDYRTAYYGKWHLNPNPRASLEQYGFSGGTYPSPNGGPGQGMRKDPRIADQFVGWLRENGGDGPWATTVSFVNPHDIAWWYRFTERIQSEAYPPQRASALPPNFETPEQLEAKGKPLLQRSLQDTAARSFGEVAFTGPEAQLSWTQMMDTYLLLQKHVDAQIGRVLHALAGQPKVAAKTVVVFTSDHGEYGGSHGLRGKGGAVYEEAIRVPLLVHDPRGQLTAFPATPRTQLTSSADFAALMLTIASGSDAWRSEPSLSHLATRLDIAKICSEPDAPGRGWVLHTTDEDVTEFASESHAADAPRHVTAIRTQQGKLALYSNWRPGSTEVEGVGQEAEFYEYATEEGQLELASQVDVEAELKEELWETLETQAIPDELEQALPSKLLVAQRQGMANYHAVEDYESEKVYASHLSGAPEPTPEAL
jgi:arylsulfatase A-like enzyme